MSTRHASNPAMPDTFTDRLRLILLGVGMLLALGACSSGGGGGGDDPALPPLAPASVSSISLSGSSDEDATVTGELALGSAAPSALSDEDASASGWTFTAALPSGASVSASLMVTATDALGNVSSYDAGITSAP